MAHLLPARVPRIVIFSASVALVGLVAAIAVFVRTGSDSQPSGAVAAPQTIAIDVPSTQSVSREQLVVDVSHRPQSIRSGERVNVRVDVQAPGGAPNEDVWLRLRTHSHLVIERTPDLPWVCDPTTKSGKELFTSCKLEAKDVALGLSEVVVFRLRSHVEARGLSGVSADAWFGDNAPDSLSWSNSLRGTSADMSMVSITPRKVNRVRSVDLLFTQRNSEVLSESTGNERNTSLSRTYPTSIAMTAQRMSTSAPSSSFCEIFGAAATVNAQVTAGPITFSGLNNSSTNGGGCSSSSVISLTAANIAFGNISFTNVSGTITPTSVTFSMKVANDGIDLVISGPFPETGTVFAAELGFNVGKSRVTLNGSIDYSDNSQFSIALTASASGLNWTPVPGLDISSTTISGSFARQVVGGVTQDSFNATISFGGNWSPLSGISLNGVTVAISESNGDVVLAISATLNGQVSLGELQVDVKKLQVTGIIDVTSEVFTASVAVGAVKIESLLSLRSVNMTYIYDPNASSTSSDTSVSLAGSASFLGPLAQFFSGAVLATVDLSNDGYVVMADMSSSPSNGGYAASSPRLVYAGLLDPNGTISYRPTLSSGTGNAIPLTDNAALAVSSYGVPSSLLTALAGIGIDLFNNIGTGTIAIGLPPSDPSISIYYSPPGDPYLIGSAKSIPSLRFDDIFLSVQTGATEAFTIGGDVTLSLADTDLDLRSAITVGVGDGGVSLDGYMELIDTTGWPNAFGISGMTVYDLLVQVGLADGLPTFGIAASASFPKTLTDPLGIVANSVISFALDLDAANPCAAFSIEPPPSNPKQNVLNIGDGALTASSAQMVLAPDGCQLGQKQYTGFQLEFAGAIRGVQVGFDTSFTLSPAFSLTGSGYIGTFPLGDLSMNQTTVNLTINQSELSITLNGGFSLGDAVNATGTATLGSSGGYFLNANGKIKINSDYFDVTIKATDCTDSSCTSIVAPSFTATGDIVLQGFSFSADFEIDADGTFDAQLSIPKHTNTFRFQNGSKTVSGDGTYTYSLFVNVSNTGSDELRIDAGVSLKSCTAFLVSCRGAKVSESSDIKTGKIDVSVDVDVIGINVKIAFST
jgi:hypothetical protein